MTEEERIDAEEEEEKQMESLRRRKHTFNLAI